MRRNNSDGEPFFVVEQSDSGVGPFLLGLALGAGIALLMAPKTGPDTRRVIGERAREFKNSARDMMDDMSENIQSTFSDAYDLMHDQVDDARNSVNRGKRQVKRAFEAGKSAARDARREIEVELKKQKAAIKDDFESDEVHG